jgi:hypothetical protein
MGFYGAPKDSRNDRKDDKPVSSGQSGDNENESKKTRRWVAGVATGVLITVLGAGAIVALSRGFDFVARGPSPALPEVSSTFPPAIARVPRTNPSALIHSPDGQNSSAICQVKEVSENPVDDQEVGAWMYPVGSVPSLDQINQITTAGSTESANQDLYDDGGYALFTDTLLILQNDCPYPATVKNIQGTTESCESPAAGALFVGSNVLSEPSTADDGVTPLGIVLCSANSDAMIATSGNYRQWTQPYKNGPLVTIPPGGEWPFNIRAVAPDSACSFVISVSVSFGGGPTTTTNIDDQGQPFRVSALLPPVPGGHPYAGYGVLYVGAAASPWHDGQWQRENPKSWRLPAQRTASR